MRYLASVALLGLAGPLLAGSPEPAATLEITLLGRHVSGIFSNSGSEIPAYDPATRRLFVTNQALARVDRLDISDPTKPRPLEPIDTRALGDGPTCVASHDGLIAVALPNFERVAAGQVAFFDVEGQPLGSVTVGSLPDMLTFTPDGRRVVVANEGEPRDYCEPSPESDPEGSVSVIDLPGDRERLGEANVRSADFRAFTAEQLDPKIRIYGPGASIAQDLEPEAVAVSSDSKTAYVTLQENNAIAVVDLETAKVSSIFALGYKDHSQAGAGLDPSDQDGGARVGTWPVWGLYLPDFVSITEGGGKRFLITANEGERRPYNCFEEEVRVADLELQPGAFPEGTQAPENLGRLAVTRSLGDADGDGRYEALYSLGGRSFSVWTPDGELVFDSGSQFEDILAAELPQHFNSDNDQKDSFDSRSANAGSEPEGLAIGRVGDRDYVFVGLERMSGVMVYDVTDPTSPRYDRYVHSRNFDGDPKAGTAGDLGPEGLLFIPADQSPTGEALLVVCYEISGTVAIYSVRPAT